MFHIPVGTWHHTTISFTDIPSENTNIEPPDSSVGSPFAPTTGEYRADNNHCSPYTKVRGPQEV